MSKFLPNQRVVLNVNPADLIHTNCGGQTLSREGVYHVEKYDEPFNGQPMVRLRECKDTVYLETLFAPAPKRKRFKRQFEPVSR